MHFCAVFVGETVSGLKCKNSGISETFCISEYMVKTIGSLKSRVYEKVRVVLQCQWFVWFHLKLTVCLPL